MSLSAILVPIAFGVIGTAITSKKVPIDIVQDEAQLENLRNHTEVGESNFFKIETPIKDAGTLQETLENYGSKVEKEKEHIDTVVGNTHITFMKEESGLYSVIFSDDIATRDAEEFVKNIVEEYTNIVQKQVYEKLM